MWSSPKQTLKGKVELFGGINEESLLAAVVDSACSDDDESYGSELLDRIETSIASVAGELGLNTDESRYWRFSREESSGCATIHIFETSEFQSIWNGEHVSYEKLMLSFSSSTSAAIPFWVKETFIEIVKQLCRAKRPFDQNEKQNLPLPRAPSNLQGAYQKSFLFVLGTLLLFFEMGVKELSYSPMPFSSLHASWRKKLFVNMILSMKGYGDASGSSAATSSPLGVALLRVLSGASRSGKPLSNDSLSWMVLRGLGRGKSTTQNVSVSVSLSEMAPDKTMTKGNDSNFTAVVKSNTQNTHGQFESSALWMEDTVTHMETNLDDITGEDLAFIIDLLLQHGAIDAWVTPIIMKKGRPAHSLHCLSTGDDGKTKSLLELMFRHSTTLGIRIYKDMPRVKLCRSIITVQTPYLESSRKGLVDVKISKFKNGEVISMKAEFDHCKDIAIDTGIPLKIVSEQALAVAREIK
jgi:hypothetical protein